MEAPDSAILSEKIQRRINREQNGPLVGWRIRSSGKIGESAGKIGGERRKNAVASASRFGILKIKPQLTLMLPLIGGGRWIMNYIMSLLAVGFVAAVMLGIVRTSTQLQSSSASRVAADASGFFVLTHSRERPEQ